MSDPGDTVQPHPTPDPTESPSSTVRCRLVLPHYQSLPTLKQYLPELLTTLESAELPVEVVVVDDGSARLMQKLVSSWIARLCHSHACLLPAQLLERNYGKGYAIRHGWAYTDASIEVLAFVDADGSVPAAAVAKQLSAALREPDTLHCGIRPAPSRATRSLKRRIMGKCFASYARRQLGIKVADPQCGFKMMPASAYHRLHRRFKINRFAFDCELLAQANLAGIAMREVELPWIEAPTSTVRSIRDGWQMVRDLRRIRKELRLWQRLSAAPPGSAANRS